MVGIYIGVGYFALGCITAGAIGETTKEEGATLFGGLFWPVTWLVVLGIGLAIMGRKVVRHTHSGRSK